MESSMLFSSLNNAVLNVFEIVRSEVVELISLMWAEAVMFGIAAIAYVLFTGGLSQVWVPKSKRKAVSEEQENTVNQARPGPARKMPLRSQGSKAGVPAASAKADVKKPQATRSPEEERNMSQQVKSALKELPENGGREAVGCAKMISAMGKEGKLWEAVEIFNKLKRGHGSSPTTLVYNCLLDACVQGGNMRLALEYFREVKEVGLADIVSFNTIMKGHLAEGNLKAAEDMNIEMSAFDIKPNRITYHGLLNARVLRGDHHGAWHLVDQMKAGGPNAVPNEVTCSILLKALGTDSGNADLTRIMDLVDTTVSTDKPMDEVLFASMVEACIRIGRLDLLSDQTRRYAKQGGLMRLTAPTYGSMIKAYGQAHDLEHVWELWEEMASRQVSPTAITLGCMIEALVMNNCVNDAWLLVQKIKKDDKLKGFVNAVIYSTILKGFSICKKPDKVVELYDEMQEHGIECNTITYNTILNAYARCSAMHRVPKLLEDMKNGTPPVEPDIVTFSTVVKGYCMAGDVDKSFEVLQEMKKEGKFMPDEVMFNSLLDGCARQHRLEDALRLLEQMREADVVPSNYTLSIVVKLLSRARRLGHAFSMVESVSKEHGFQLNVQVYTCLIQACFYNRQLGKAFKLYDDIVQEQRIVPDEKLFSILVKGCVQAGNIDKAVEFVRCAHGLPGHTLAQPTRSSPGVEPRCVEEVVSRLGASSNAAKELLADLQTFRKHGGSRPRAYR